jgi:glycosyltransferase involved in cell wall biosynthesis
VHSSDDIIDAEEMSHRLSWLANGQQPLRLVYFGRLVPYKGLDRAVEALAIARDRSRRDLRLVLIGEGESKPHLEQQVARLGLRGAVEFRPMVP